VMVPCRSKKHPTLNPQWRPMTRRFSKLPAPTIVGNPQKAVPRPIANPATRKHCARLRPSTNGGTARKTRSQVRNLRCRSATNSISKVNSYQPGRMTTSVSRQVENEGPSDSRQVWIFERSSFSNSPAVSCENPHILRLIPRARFGNGPRVCWPARVEF